MGVVVCGEIIFFLLSTKIMYQFTLFEALIITHLIGDFLFQSRWETLNKDKKLLPLFLHCFIYTICFIPVFLIYKANLVWLFFIFVSHIILDQRKFELWIIEKIKRFRKEEVKDWLWWAALMVTDQTCHLIILVIITLFSV